MSWRFGDLLLSHTAVYQKLYLASFARAALEWANVYLTNTGEACENECFEQMSWITPQYGTGRIDAAGKLLAGRIQPTERLCQEEALNITANWRASHAYPLRVMCATLRSRAKRIDEEVLIVQRLKRMPSIASKLRRFDRMQLSQMQDLGGCRAVMSSCKEVYELVSLYESIPTEVASLCRKTDYISAPKESGYRGVHLVYEYNTQNEPLPLRLLTLLLINP